MITQYVVIGAKPWSWDLYKNRVNFPMWVFTAGKGKEGIIFSIEKAENRIWQDLKCGEMLRYAWSVGEWYLTPNGKRCHVGHPQSSRWIGYETDAQEIFVQMKGNRKIVFG